jgi:hypothetical protein
MPSKRTTIWLTEAAQAAIAGAPSASGEISRVLVAYAELARAVGSTPTDPGSEDAIRSAIIRYEQCWREAVPALSRGEWLLICDALNATWRSGASGRDIAHSLSDEIAETGPDGLPEKWQVDLPALESRLRAMPFAARTAIIEVVDRFWAGVTGGLQSHDDLLRAAGARIDAAD